jgi:hypothetical protein
MCIQRIYVVYTWWIYQVYTTWYIHGTYMVYPYGWTYKVCPCIMIYHVYTNHMDHIYIYMEYTWYFPGIYNLSGFQMHSDTGRIPIYGFYYGILRLRPKWYMWHVLVCTSGWLIHVYISTCMYIHVLSELSKLIDQQPRAAERHRSIRKQLNGI